ADSPAELTRNRFRSTRSTLTHGRNSLTTARTMRCDGSTPAHRAVAAGVGGARPPLRAPGPRLGDRAGAHAVRLDRRGLLVHARARVQGARAASRGRARRGPRDPSE